jgi:hypothetical protein
MTRLIIVVVLAATAACAENPVAPTVAAAAPPAPWWGGPWAAMCPIERPVCSDVGLGPEVALCVHYVGADADPRVRPQTEGYAWECWPKSWLPAEWFWDGPGGK